ncbi:MAG: hypothetical protein LC640_13640, partial [Frankia sp.]|nr:hypothetical protein [Frankia sp.]
MTRALVLLGVLSLVLSACGSVVETSAIASATATVTPSPTLSLSQKSSGPSTLVYCGTLTGYAAPTQATGGTVTIDRPGNRRDRGGPVTLGIPPGPPSVSPAGWTCLRLIGGAPAASFVGFVAPGADGYIAQPSPTPRGEYANPSLLYYLTLPEPYRVSDILKSDNMGPDVASGTLPATGEAFTPRTRTDEAALASQRCESACAIWSYVVSIDMFTDRASPRDWYAKHRGATGEAIEDLTIDGRAAIRVTGGAQYPVQLIINDNTWILRVAYQ